MGGSCHCNQAHTLCQTAYLDSLRLQGSKLWVEVAIIIRHILCVGPHTLLVCNCKAANYR
eukprot:8488699-Ditylum_brightwellii.AAC.1